VRTSLPVKGFQATSNAEGVDLDLELESEILCADKWHEMRDLRDWNPEIKSACGR
jgi:hypothetical protein